MRTLIFLMILVLTVLIYIATPYYPEEAALAARSFGLGCVFCIALE